jgi:hypothetical protein
MDKESKPGIRTLVPDADIQGVLRHERRYLHTFFSKLADANISTLADLEKYSAQELFEAAPTSKSNQARFMGYVQRDLITLRTP